MRRPRLLDLFSCEGGAGAGYEAAGFDVLGVDIEDKSRRYPFAFRQGDALALLPELVADFAPDVVHASPPCQAYSITKHSHSVAHPDLLGPTRDALVATGLPYVIENVPGAPMRDPLLLCGTMFGLVAEDLDGSPLHLRRHRLFESNVLLMGPGTPCECADYRRRGIGVGGVYGGGSADRQHARHVRRGGYTPDKAVRAALIGADWMTIKGLSQSIPPAYTRFLGSQLLDAVAGVPA